jgi:NAD(P)-dependent dehydrogenase (short-subunit alcohol dehydrogenase family)
MITQPRRRALVTGASRLGGLDALVANHARSSVGGLASLTAVTKGALHQLTLTLSDALADLGATVNTINPGPTDTGWADPELDDRVGRAMPRGRWNTPEEAAGVVALLLTADATNITGRVIDAEGGFRRWAD